MLTALIILLAAGAGAQPLPSSSTSTILPAYVALGPNLNDFDRFADGGPDANWYVGYNNAWIVRLPPAPAGDFPRAFIGAKIGRAKTRPNPKKPWLRELIPGKIYIGVSQNPWFSTEQSFSGRNGGHSAGGQPDLLYPRDRRVGMVLGRGSGRPDQLLQGQLPRGLVADDLFSKRVKLTDPGRRLGRSRRRRLPGNPGLEQPLGLGRRAPPRRQKPRNAHQQHQPGPGHQAHPSGPGRGPRLGIHPQPLGQAGDRFLFGGGGKPGRGLGGGFPRPTGLGPPDQAPAPPTLSVHASRRQTALRGLPARGGARRHGLHGIQRALPAALCQVNFASGWWGRRGL